MSTLIKIIATIIICVAYVVYYILIFQGESFANDSQLRLVEGQEKVNSKEGIGKEANGIYSHVSDADVDDWRLLLNVSLTKLDWKWCTCYSREYLIHLSKLPPIRASSLVPPPNTTILMYGTSYMVQLHSQIKIGLDVTCNKHTAKLNWGTRECNGAKITLISNKAQYQDGPKGLENLKKLLEKKYFDAVFFMKPHPRCFFKYKRVKELGWKNFSKYACVNLNTFKSKLDPIRDIELWKTVQSSPNVKHAIFVEPWEMATRTSPSNSSYFSPNALVHQYPCSNPGCAPVPAGHQCVPGALTMAAKEMMSLLYDPATLDSKP